MTTSPAPLQKCPDRVAIARYGAATNDFTPIHYDDDIAKGVGLPGVIAHGLLSLGYVGQFLTDWCDGDPSRVQRTRMRFARPVLPGDDLVVEATATAETDDGVDITFVVRRADDIVAEGDATVSVPEGG